MRCNNSVYVWFVQAVLQHTASQKADLLFLRRLFFGKIGQLARQRRDILQCMSNLESEPRGTGKRHDTLNELTMQLQENGREDYRTHVQLTGAMHEGVSHLCRRASFRVITQECTVAYALLCHQLCFSCIRKSIPDCYLGQLCQHPLLSC